MFIWNNGQNVNEENFQFGNQNINNINIEVSYDNYDDDYYDIVKKQQYANDLRVQIEENKRRRLAEIERKKLEDIEEELRILRERELIRKRLEAEYKKYRPKLNPIEVKKKILLKSHSQPTFGNLTTLEYLRLKEDKINTFRNKMMHSLNTLKNEYKYSIMTLKGQIGAMNDINERNKRYRNKAYRDLYSIRDDVEFRKRQNGIDARNLYDLVAKSNYNKHMLGFNIGHVPKRNFVIKSYVDKNKSYVEDKRKDGGLKIPCYINFSRNMYNKGPRWRKNQVIWYYY